jgi:hypothetical protein
MINTIACILNIQINLVNSTHPQQMQVVTATPGALLLLLLILLMPAGGESSYSALERGLLEHEITSELLLEVSSSRHQNILSGCMFILLILHATAVLA